MTHVSISPKSAKTASVFLAKTCVFNVPKNPEMNSAPTLGWWARKQSRSEGWCLFCIWNSKEEKDRRKEWVGGRWEEVNEGGGGPVALEWHKCAEVVSYAESEEQERPEEAQLQKNNPRLIRLIPSWRNINRLLWLNLYTSVLSLCPSAVYRCC